MIETYILWSAKNEQHLLSASPNAHFSFPTSPSLFARSPSSSSSSSPSAPSLDLPLFDVSFLSFPIPAHKQDNFKSYVGQVFGLFLVVAFMWPFSRMVRNMVEEKEMKLSEGVRAHTHTHSYTLAHTASFNQKPETNANVDSFFLYPYLFVCSLCVVR